MCTCIVEANKALKEHNTVIVLDTAIDFATGKVRSVLSLPVKRINPKIKKGPLRLQVNFCPLCGEKASTSTGGI